MILKPKIYVVNDILGNWQSELVRDFFQKIVSIKYGSYKKTYGPLIAPFDTSDFFGTHVILTDTVEGKEEIVFAYKTVTNRRCEDYGMTFPGLALVQKDGNKESQRAMRDILENSRLKNFDISYESSWALNPFYRKVNNYIHPEQIRDLLFASVVNFHIEYNIPEMIACGVLKVKTQNTFLKMGLNPLCEKSTFKQSNVANEPIIILHGQSFSKYALEVANRHEKLWEDKVCIGVEEEVVRSNIFVAA